MHSQDYKLSEASVLLERLFVAHGVGFLQRVFKCSHLSEEGRSCHLAQTPRFIILGAFSYSSVPVKNRSNHFICIVFVNCEVLGVGIWYIS